MVAVGVLREPSLDVGGRGGAFNIAIRRGHAPPAPGQQQVLSTAKNISRCLFFHANLCSSC
jgi:hypothetical protein